jgi:hypothetical protein
MLGEPDDVEKDHFAEIYGRRHRAQSVERCAVLFADGSRPTANECHANVDRWVGEHPDHTAVRGWIIMSEMAEMLYLAAHSVVGSPQRSLFDITPLPALNLPFIPHWGPESEFQKLRANHATVTWPPVA